MYGLGIGSGQFPQPLTTYNGKVLVGQGISLVVASVLLTGQVAAIGSTPLVTAAGGRFRVSVYGLVTTGFTTAGLTVTIGWNDGTAAQTFTGSPNPSGITVGSITNGSVFLASGGANITYSTSSTGTIGAYSLAIVAEQLV